MELILEIFLELYMELMFLIVPDKKGSKGFKAVAVIIAVIVILGILALVILGIGLIEDKNWWGFLLISIAVVISIAQIIAGMALYDKNHD